MVCSNVRRSVARPGRDGGEGLVVILVAAGDLHVEHAAADDAADHGGQLLPVGRVHLHGRAVAALFGVAGAAQRDVPRVAGGGRR